MNFTVVLEDLDLGQKKQSSRPKLQDKVADTDGGLAQDGRLARASATKARCYIVSGASKYLIQSENGARILIAVLVVVNLNT